MKYGYSKNVNRVTSFIDPQKAVIYSTESRRVTGNFPKAGGAVTQDACL
jgi:hypothetical protein